jgi:hypothetical protein
VLTFEPMGARGKRLDLAFSQTRNGAPFHAWTAFGNSSQKFTFILEPNHYNPKRPQDSLGQLSPLLTPNKRLDLAFGHQENGAKFHLWDKNDGINQKFRLITHYELTIASDQPY